MLSDAADGPGGVLAQPTRARLFSHLARLGRPASTAELAAELALHPSGVRVHLERLRVAGLVSREQVAQPRGRPRASWSIASDARPGGEPPDGYRQLARWLARAIPARPGRVREVERAGRELGRELLAASPARAPETLGRTFTALGFAPQRQPTQPGKLALRLGNCPYRDAARENQPVVCALHRGITRGLLDQLAPPARLTGFVPEDPERAGCLVEVENLTMA